MKVKIDPEFSALIPAVPADQDGELEELCISERRIRDPIVIWKHQNILLDGHRRWKIHLKHPQLPMAKAEVKDFETRDEAHNWIINNQLSKRNVSDAQRKYLIGKLYVSERNPRGGEQTAKVAVCPNSAEKVASEHGVSERTVYNAAKFSEAVDSVPPEVKTAVLAGEVQASTKDLTALAELTPKQQARAATVIANGKAHSVSVAVKAAKPKRGEPTVDVRCFKALESQLGKCVRANTECKEKCGGAKYHEQVRQHLNGALKVLAEWRKGVA